jgi:rifampicin phosphotransferase
VVFVATVRMVLPLDAQGAAVAAVGGKGASLSRLACAGLPVPPGFCVTTLAYCDFAERDERRQQIAEVLATVDASGPATFAAASHRLGEMFAAWPVGDFTVESVTGMYAGMGDRVAVAVRSSATTEDLADLSFAGQHTSYLNVRGEAAVLAAVKRCWASLWSPRAIGYRAQHGRIDDDVSMAVVVQRLVVADAAGVLFTADPVTGDRGHVVINANWGLGESVVSGQVSPDIITVGRASGRAGSYEIGSKAVMTVLTSDGTREQDTAAGRRAAAVLSGDEAAELARTGLAVEKLYGQPVDVEWARADGQFFVLQARPVTSQPPAHELPASQAPPSRAGGLTGVQPGEEWNDTLDGDYLWTNGNLGEAIPDVMTPATWSFIELFMTRAINPPHVGDYHGYGRVAGRFYTNFSMSVALSALAGLPKKRFLALTEPVFGKLPPGVEVPRVRLPRFKIIRMTVPLGFANMRRLNKARKGLENFVAAAPDRCDALRAGIGRIDDHAALAALWSSHVEPLFVEASDMLTAGAVGTAGLALLTVPRRLATLIGPADAAVLLSGQEPGQADLASLGPAVALSRLAHGEIDRDTFLRQYGHRGPHELEVSVPRPAEDPAWIDRELSGLSAAAEGARARLARQRAAREAIWSKLAKQPKQAARARTMVARWAVVARAREATRSELVRSMWVLRAWVLRAGELTGHGDDVFFLSYPEILDVLRGDRSPLSAVPARRASYQTYRALPPYPAVIRGRFDPVRWAADPARRTDYYDEHATAAPPGPDGDTVTGFPGAAGVVEGVARVIASAEDAGQLGDGEILVTTSTNIGWTPIFPRAAAVVTDVGAPLSHAAIVARELGLPAVVGCGNATMRLHSGDRIRVDGGQGTVEVLSRRSSTPAVQ